MLTPAEENQLINRIRERDQSALAALYHLYGAAVYHLAFHILQAAPAAEEITQDVFFHLWVLPESWDDSKGRLLNWLLTVTRYSAIDRLRHERYHGGTSALATHAPLEDTDPHRRTENSDMIHGMLTQLSPPEAQVIQLVYFMGMTPDECASQLHMTPAGVRTLLKNALKHLRDLWRHTDGA